MTRTIGLVVNVEDLRSELLGHMSVGFGPSKTKMFFPFFTIKILGGGGLTNVVYKNKGKGPLFL